MEPVTPWFEDFKDDFEQELKSFRDLGLLVDEDAIMKKDGILTIQIEVPVKNKLNLALNSPLKIRIIYPDNYPFFKPEVFADNLVLPRHQNPIAKNLCLLARGTDQWIVGQTAADYLKEQLPKLLVKGFITDQTVIGQDIDEQAEPLSDYFKGRGNLIIMSDFPSRLEGSNLSQGTFRFRLEKYDKEFSFEDTNHLLKVVIPTWKDSIGKTISQGEGSSTFEAPWVRVDSIPIEKEKREALFNEKLKQFQFKSLTPPIKIRNGRITMILGLTFPEEVTRGKIGWGWIFILMYSANGKSGLYQLVAGSRIGREEYLARIPKLNELTSKTISIAGLGSLGAPSAIEFARNCVKKIRILDFDTVDPTSTVRWPLGIRYAGLNKAIALKEFINENYPFTDVEIIVHRIGAPREMNFSDKSERQILRQFLEESSLVYDCTGESGISNLLFYESRLAHIPFITISATPGVWGGMVTRSVPFQTHGCWLCLQHHLMDKTISPALFDPTADIQPAGCGDKTFVGASFELQNVMLAGVRLAASTLSRDKGSYPDFEWDVAVLSLVDNKGKITLPTWREYIVQKHPKCVYCADE